MCLCARMCTCVCARAHTHIRRGEATWAFREETVACKLRAEASGMSAAATVTSGISAPDNETTLSAAWVIWSLPLPWGSLIKLMQWLSTTYFGKGIKDAKFTPLRVGGGQREYKFSTHSVSPSMLQTKLIFNCIIFSWETYVQRV